MLKPIRLTAALIVGLGCFFAVFSLAPAPGADPRQAW